MRVEALAPADPHGLLRVTVVVRAPLYFPVASRLLDPDGRAPFEVPLTAAVTARIIERSREGRADYLRRMEAARHDGPGRAKLSCANWAHAFAASPAVGTAFLAFIAVTLITAFGLIAVRSERLATPASLESLVSRESAFVLNNVVLLAATRLV